MQLKKFHYIIIATALLVYCITAYNSHGYIQEDEHYQIIEFAQLKLGHNQISDMPWEYKEKMRSAFQPSIAYAVFTIANKLSITDPYLQAFILRLLSALLAIIIITQFVKSTIAFIDIKYQKFYIFISYLLWFFPFVNVRFSSEAWAGLLFLAATALILKDKKPYFIIGLLLGASFLCRFQSAILSASLISWLLFIKKDDGKNILKLCIGGSIFILIGIITDRWLYGQFTFTPWNYFYNTMLADATQSFGDSPWYAYNKIILLRPSLFIGLPLIASLIILFITDRKNLFLWITIPFFIIHSIISHKEYRFLFPLINFIPVILLSGYQNIQQYFSVSVNKKLSFITRITLLIILAANTIALIAIATRAADGRVAISKYIHNKYPKGNLKIAYSKWGDYFTKELPANFYRQKNVELLQLDSLSQLNVSDIDTTKINFFVLRHGLDEVQNKNAGDILNRLAYKMEMQSLPPWIIQSGVPAKLIFENEVLDLYIKQ